MESLTLLKVGGGVVEEPNSLEKFLDDFAKVEGQKVLVHGGGRSATKMAERLGVETQMVNGRRITNASMLQVVTMVYGGLVNKNIVVELQSRGVDALGLTGADMNYMLAEKRKNAEIDYGFVGDVKKVDARKLQNLINQNIVPILAPLTHDGHGNLLNTNADTIAGEAAKALAELYDVTLVFCFEKKGVLRDENDDDSVIPTLNKEDFLHYVESGVIQGGMIPKLQNAFEALEAGVKRVIITKADEINKNSGTTITL